LQIDRKKEHLQVVVEEEEEIGELVWDFSGVSFGEFCVCERERETK
jgi:hypothetical protein